MLQERIDTLGNIPYRQKEKKKFTYMLEIAYLKRS